MSLGPVRGAAEMSLTPALALEPTQKSRKVGDLVFLNITRGFAGFVLLLLSAIILSLIFGSAPAFHKFGLAFFTTASWNPVTENFGGLSPIIGTINSSFGALLVGVPIS